MPLIQKKYNKEHEYLKNDSYDKLYRDFCSVMKTFGMRHTPHETSMQGQIKRLYRLVGHASRDVTSKVYTHKDIEQLRKAIESFP